MRALAMRTFEAALTYRDTALAFLGDPSRTLSLRLPLDPPSSTGPSPDAGAFGLLEGDARGWTLCIPDGAEAEVSIDDRALDLAGIWVEPSGERRLRLCEGLSAHVRMGEFDFDVRA